MTLLPLRQMLFGKKSPAPLAPLPVLTVELVGQLIEVKLKRHAAAKRMVLRLDRDGRSFNLTMPKRQSLVSAKAFLETSKLWMQNTLAHRGHKAPEQLGTTVLLRGVAIAIVKTEKLRGLVHYDDAAKILHVPGGEAHWQRRLTDWLKQEAEKDLRAASQLYAAKMQTQFSKLSVRDQKSRWGSCTSDGALSYSWRLILAPSFVLDYVAAHEVAHLKEMNHGPRFWCLVLGHCARTREAKQWLKARGHELHHGI
jgi:predicted metal-dependent hydrolase